MANHNRPIRDSGCCCFSDINISQGSGATRLRCGGIFYFRFARNLLLSLSVKFVFFKSVSNDEVRGENIVAPNFYRTRYSSIILNMVELARLCILNESLFYPFFRKQMQVEH